MSSITKMGGTICALALSLTSILRPVLAEPVADEAVDAQSAAVHEWRGLMTQNLPLEQGCFHASYPNAWEKRDCTIAQPRVHPKLAKSASDEADDAGNINDYVAHATGLITSAVGGLEIKGVTSERSVGVAEYKYAGILGANEYSIQMNTNAKEATSAWGCSGRRGCKVWQQFVYSTDYVTPGVAEVYMQYWLLNYGSCPSGWTQESESSNCYFNSPLADAPDLPATELGTVYGVDFATYAQAGGFDCVTLYYGSETVSNCFPDFMLDISSVWNKAEFNIVGDGGGSRADFNKGTTIWPLLYVYDGSHKAPTCLSDAGTTGESNNLNLGKCTTGVANGHTPYIRFEESR